MKPQIKIFVIAILNLAFIIGIRIAINFDTYLWILFTIFYLCGTLLGSFFGFYVKEKFIEEQSDKTSTLPNGNPNGEFNKGLEASATPTPKLSPTEITSPNPNYVQ